MGDSAYLFDMISAFGYFVIGYSILWILATIVLCRNNTTGWMALLLINALLLIAAIVIGLSVIYINNCGGGVMRI